MALLFNTQDELKQCVGTPNINNDLNTLQAYLVTAGDKYMVPALGREYWEILTAGYEDNDLSAADQAILPFVQMALANFAYFLYVEDAGLTVSDGGITSMESLDAKRPAQWQLRDYKRNRLNSAWEAIRTLLVKLRADKGDYDTWWECDERKEIWGCLIWDYTIFSKYRRIDGGGTLNALQPYMKAALDIDIAANITPELLQDVLAWWIDAGTDEDYDLLKPYVERALVYCTLVRAAEDLPIQVQPTGIYIDEVDRGLQNDQTRRMVQHEQLMRVKYGWQNEMKNALAALRTFLDENAANDKYADYFNSDKYQVEGAMGMPDDAYTGGTFLM